MKREPSSPPRWAISSIMSTAELFVVLIGVLLGISNFYHRSPEWASKEIFVYDFLQCETRRNTKEWQEKIIKLNWFVEMCSHQMRKRTFLGFRFQINAKANQEEEKYENRKRWGRKSFLISIHFANGNFMHIFSLRRKMFSLETRGLRCSSDARRKFLAGRAYLGMAPWGRSSCLWWK